MFRSLSCFLFLRDERHHHVLVPGPVDGRCVGRGAGAVTPGGHLPVTLCTGVTLHNVTILCVIFYIRAVSVLPQLPVKLIIPFFLFCFIVIISVFHFRSYCL